MSPNGRSKLGFLIIFSTKPMNNTLYVLRRRSNEIPRTLFHDSDREMDVVLIEEAASHAVSYDDLVKKIFEAERTIVI